jgi:hypothetical protein
MNYEDAIRRGKAKHGEKFVEPSTNELQRRYFDASRVEVTTTYESGETYVRRGRISITTGWRPALMLMHTRSASGSSDLLKASDVVTAWIDSRGKRHPL